MTSRLHTRELSIEFHTLCLSRSIYVNLKNLISKLRMKISHKSILYWIASRYFFSHSLSSLCDFNEKEKYGKPHSHWIFLFDNQIFQHVDGFHASLSLYLFISGYNKKFILFFHPKQQKCIYLLFNWLIPFHSEDGWKIIYWSWGVRRGIRNKREMMFKWSSEYLKKVFCVAWKYFKCIPYSF